MSGPVRVANALLRGVGGRTVLLHIPVPAIPGDVGEQLGLALPEFQDVELGPVVFRKVRPRLGTAENARTAACELLVSAACVERLVGALACDSADVLFASAAGVLVDGDVLEIAAVTEAEAFGAVYLYRLVLKAPARQLV